MKKIISLLLVFGGAFALSAKKSPNVLYIISDDLFQTIRHLPILDAGNRIFFDAVHIIAQTGAPFETASPDKPFEIRFSQEGGPAGFQMTEVQGISDLFLLSGGRSKESHSFSSSGWRLQELHDRRKVTIFLGGGCGVNLIKPSDEAFFVRLVAAHHG